MENSGDMHEILCNAAKGIDGKVWAKAYLAVVRQIPPPVVTEEFMENWFSNAIMAGFDVGFVAGKNQASRVADND